MIAGALLFGISLSVLSLIESTTTDSILNQEFIDAVNSKAKTWTVSYSDRFSIQDFVKISNF